MNLPLTLFLTSVLTLVKYSFSEAVGPRPDINHHTKDPQTTSLSATMTTLASVVHTQSSPAAPANNTAASHQGAGDPCGPYGNQTPFETTLNTCGKINTTYTEAPSTYGVECLNMNPTWDQSINMTSCESNIDDLCDATIAGTVVASQWNWSSGGPNCTAGLWFNPYPAAEPRQRWTTCRDDIYWLMAQTCFPTPGPPFNVAAVNLLTLPDLTTNGSQVDAGYPSYIIVPQTYDDTFAA